MTPFFTLFILSRASDTLLIKILGGRMRGPSPHLKFWGQCPLGLCPWAYDLKVDAVVVMLIRVVLLILCEAVPSMQGSQDDLALL